VPTIRTIAVPLRHEPPKIKGSRFIASAVPIESTAAATGFVEECREEYRDATHNCFAWRLGTDRDAFRASDDGEPSGTAGRPILQEIDGRRLTDLAVVVTRYYGGTKLGTGGLIRAYGGAAAEVLDLVAIVETPITDQLRLDFTYDFSGSVHSVLTAFNISPSHSEYGSEVRLDVAVPIENTELFRQALNDATRGRITIS